jgi:hypothetical protein
VDNAANARLERLADRVQQIGEVRIVGGLFYAYPADARVPEVGKERLDVFVFGQPTIIARNPWNCESG